MNKKYQYVLTGISKEQVTVWREDMREDVTLLEKGGLIIPIINLSRWDAFKMRIQIMSNNIKNNYGFGLARI